MVGGAVAHPTTGHETLRYPYGHRQAQGKLFASSGRLFTCTCGTGAGRKQALVPKGHVYTLTLYREEYKGRQRDPRMWAGGPYGDVISLEQIETLDHIHTRLDASVIEIIFSVLHES